MRFILGVMVLALVVTCDPQLPPRTPVRPTPQPEIWTVVPAKAGDKCFLVLQNRWGVLATKEVECDKR